MSGLNQYTVRVRCTGVAWTVDVESNGAAFAPTGVEMSKADAVALAREFTSAAYLPLVVDGDAEDAEARNFNRPALKGVPPPLLETGEAQT